MLMISLSFKL